MLKFGTKWIVVAISLLMISQYSRAAMIDITAAVDGRIRDVNGTSIGPVIITNDILEVFLHENGFDTRTIMEFDTSAVAGMQLASANILINSADYGDGVALDVYAYSGNGTIENADAFAVTIAGIHIASTAGPNTVSLDTSVLQSLLDGGATHFGVMMRTTTFAGTAFTDTDSSLLRIETTVVPLPAAAWLFGSALLGLGALKLKKA